MSAISLYRFYNPSRPEIETMNDDVVLYTKDDSIDARDLIKSGHIGQYYIDEIAKILHRDGYKKYFKIDIWDNPYLVSAGISPKVPLKYRILRNRRRIFCFRILIL